MIKKHKRKPTCARSKKMDLSKPLIIVIAIVACIALICLIVFLVRQFVIYYFRPKNIVVPKAAPGPSKIITSPVKSAAADKSAAAEILRHDKLAAAPSKVTKLVKDMKKIWFQHSPPTKKTVEINAEIESFLASGKLPPTIKNGSKMKKHLCDLWLLEGLDYYQLNDCNPQPGSETSFNAKHYERTDLY